MKLNKTRTTLNNVSNEYITGTIEYHGSISIPIKDSLYFEIGSYYTMHKKPFSTKYNRIRWVSDKKTQTFIDMLITNIKYGNDTATIYFKQEH